MQTADELPLDQFEEIPQTAVIASKLIADTYIRLGRPPTPFSESGQKFMNFLIAVWEKLYPVDAQIWHDKRKEYQNAELSISEQVSKRTGRSLASYPLPLYQMMKKTFVGFDAAERKNCMKMVKLWPMFKFANKA